MYPQNNDTRQYDKVGSPRSCPNCLRGRCATDRTIELSLFENINENSDLEKRLGAV